ncbi:ribonuclease HI family protein [Undibacterium sp. Ren11W]|uniref:ribonuclease HI family protein n=1 Tax=Undibacterium sp. Ren11W TaxID=3413045 RepID=UPI003BF00251
MQKSDSEFSAEFERLLDLAFHAEKVASRRLARQLGCSLEQALRQTLALVAGPAGLAQLCAQRLAQRAELAATLAARRQLKVEARAAQSLQQQAPAHAWRAWFDGSAHPNPGRCGIGAVLIAPDGRQFEISQAAGYGNSSEAEYLALIALLEMALPLQPPLLFVYGDSQVVIHDVQGSERLAALSLQRYRSQVWTVLRQMPEVHLRWVPRHKNAVADALSQSASGLIVSESADIHTPDTIVHQY